MPSPNKFVLTTDYASLPNKDFIELQVTVPAGTFMGTLFSNVSVEFNATRTIDSETGQFMLGKIYSTSDSADIRVGTMTTFARTNYEVACLVSSTSTTVKAQVFCRNRKTSDTNSGAAETIVFQLRPLGPIF